VPPQEHVERKLAAILAADVVGYSRLMGANEVGTLRALKAHRKDLFDPLIAAHGGRIVKTTGDGLLVDFASVVDAVACAVTVQRGMNHRNKDLPQDQRIVFRIGINVGDIIIDGNDIFGDGVNIAARLEALCVPGGVCISHIARDQVGDRLPLSFADLGEHMVKNITKPVRAFGLSPQAIMESPEISLGRAVSPIRRNRQALIASIAVLVVVLAGSVGWWMLRHAMVSPVLAPGADPRPAAANPPHPSIAVLPLVSLVESSRDDYFADGLTEDIISALGRFSEISVRSRNSVFIYKGKSPRPEDVGRELDVRYIVEGSVRRSPERIRVSIRLTDASRGSLLWSEQYDTEPKDIFAVQDDITRRITGALAVRLSNLELARAAAKPPSNLEAYDFVLRGRDLLLQGTRTTNSQARQLFEKAIELDPDYVPAYVGLGRVDFKAVTEGWTANASDALQRAESLGRKAIKMDEPNAGAHALLGRVHLRRGDYDRALDEMKHAVALNSSDADSYAGLGDALLWTGDFEGAIKALETAVQFQPIVSGPVYFNLGTAFILAGRYADAIRTLERSRTRYKDAIFNNVMLAAAYAAAGRQEDADRQAETVRRLSPFFAIADFGSLFRNPEHREKIVTALKQAGL
jgi:class 3 adenylate cyclase/TolB-like protein/Flp pilus assembly protein TadD